MTTKIEAAIAMIKCAVTGEPVALPEGYETNQTINLLFKQGLLTMGYTAAMICQCPMDEKSHRIVLDRYCMDVVRSEQQMEKVQAISDAFEENGIDYMPVKGALLKHMYPNPEMRKMSDADILIRQEQYEKIIPVMKALGFTESGESDHEHIWTSDYLKVELHKRLMPTYHKDYYSFFGEGWDLAKIQNGHRWSMTEEDAFIYNFIHFAKHYRDGEGNCRFVIDLWVHMRCHPELDMDYIRRKMADMRMEAFYDNIMRVIETWFGDRPWDEVTERITQVLFTVDAEERKQAHAVARSVHATHTYGDARAAEKNYRKQILFPDRDHMNWSYPQWKKVPLPIAWVLRWFHLVFFRRKTVQERSHQQTISEQQRESYRKDLEYVGLQFSDAVVLPD